MRSGKRLVIFLAIFAFVTAYLVFRPGASRDVLGPVEASSAEPGPGEINRTLALMDAWLVRDLNEEGYFNYEYYPLYGNYSAENNMIRQLMASRTLAELSLDDERLRSLHKKNMDYVFSHWYRSDLDRGYILFANDSRLGANAMALRAICASPLFGEYEEEAGALYLGILSLQNPNGSFRPYYVEPGYGYDGAYQLSFYSGEAIMGLLDYYDRTGDKKVLEAAIRSQDYYVGEYADRMDENYRAFYVPWHTMSLYRLYDLTGEERYAQAAFKTSDRLILSQEESGRFFGQDDREYGQPFSAIAGLDVDGLTYAYELAVRLNDSARAQRYRLGVSRGLRYVISLQYTDTADASTLGAIRADYGDGDVRVDATQHSQDAFRRALRIYSADTK
jgi:hypothetical protein